MSELTDSPNMTYKINVLITEGNFSYSSEEDLSILYSQNTTSTVSAVPKAVEALMYIMYILVSVAAIGGNGVVCYIVFAYQRMRTVTNFFIVNLAVGDILMASLCIPFGFVSNLLLQYWPFGAVMCVIVSYAQAVSVFISAYTLVAISFDRYIAILYPLRPKMTKLQAKLTIALVWLVSLLTPLPTAIMSRLEQPKEWIVMNITDRYTCMEAWESPTQRYHYSMALMVLQYFFPLVVLIFTYTRIAIIVWGKKAPGEAQDDRDQRMAASKRKMLKMMITVVSVFTLCWLPLNTLIVAGDEYEDIWQFRHIQYVWFACHWLAMSSTAYNPIIYCWMNNKYREGFRQICCRMACCGDGKSRRFRKTNDSVLRRCNTYNTNSMYTSVRSTVLYHHRGSSFSSWRGSLPRGSVSKHANVTKTDSSSTSSSMKTVLEFQKDKLLKNHGPCIAEEKGDSIV